MELGSETSIEELEFEFEVVISAGDDDQLESMLGDAQSNIHAACAAMKSIHGKVMELVTLRVREHACLLLSQKLEGLQRAQAKLTEFRCIIAERLAQTEAADDVGPSDGVAPLSPLDFQDLQDTELMQGGGGGSSSSSGNVVVDVEAAPAA